MSGRAAPNEMPAPGWSQDGPPGDGRPGGVDPYLRAIRAHPLLFCLVVLATLAGTAAWLAVREPTYEATAELLVSPVPEDDTFFLGLPVVRASGDATRTMQTAAALVDSSEAARLAAVRLGRGWDARRVKDVISVQPQGETSVLDIRAEADSPQLATRAANDFTAVALAIRRQSLRQAARRAITDVEARLAAATPSGGQPGPGATQLAERLGALQSVSTGNDPTLTLSQSAGLPTEAGGPPTPLIAALALMAGLVLATGAALALELAVAPRVMDEEELTSIYPVPILARVPRVARGRRDGAALTPAAGVSEAFRTLRVQLELAAGRHRAIMFTSASQSDGKTTSVADFALELAASNKSVVVIDLDLRQADLAATLGVRPERDITAVLWPGGKLVDAMTTVPGHPQIRVVAASALSSAYFLERLGERLPELIAEARSSADYVLLDTPPLGQVADALTLAGAVDDVIVVAQLGSTTRASLEVMRDLLERSGRRPTGYVVIGRGPKVIGQYPYAGDPTRPDVNMLRSFGNGDEPLEVGELRLDVVAGRAWRGETEVHLSDKAFALLETLMRHEGQVVSRQQLLSESLDEEIEQPLTLVDAYIRYLRERVDRPFGIESIETVSGAGYRLRPIGGRGAQRAANGSAEPRGEPSEHSDVFPEREPY